jgi:hypothetical protein
MPKTKKTVVRRYSDANDGVEDAPLRPEFIARLRRAEKEKRIPLNDIASYFRLRKKRKQKR